MNRKFCRCNKVFISTSFYSEIAYCHFKYSSASGGSLTLLKSNASYKFLPFCNKKINQNIINLGNAGIGPNLKNLLCQLNKLSGKKNIDNENLPN